MNVPSPGTGASLARNAVVNDRVAARAVNIPPRRCDAMTGLVWYTPGRFTRGPRPVRTVSRSA